MSDVLVIKCNYPIRPKELNELRNTFIEMMKEGVVMVPNGFDVIVVPDNTEIVMEEKEND